MSSGEVRSSVRTKIADFVSMGVPILTTIGFSAYLGGMMISKEKELSQIKEEIVEYVGSRDGIPGASRADMQKAFREWGIDREIRSNEIAYVDLRNDGSLDAYVVGMGSKEARRIGSVSPGTVRNYLTKVRGEVE